MLSVRFVAGAALGYVIGARGGREQLDSVIAKIRGGLGQDTSRPRGEARGEPGETGGDHAPLAGSAERTGDKGPKHKARVPAAGATGGTSPRDDNIPTPAELAEELEEIGAAPHGTAHSAKAKA